MPFKDEEITKLIAEEEVRQQKHIELIASENFVSSAVLAATGSVLTNKYAEGYPGHRYYDGCETIDKIETIAIERLKKLFGVKYANVQPHSGTQANIAALSALIKPGDRVLSMALASGGHLSHGHKAAQAGLLYEIRTYDVNEEGLIDYNEVEAIADEFKPHLIICGYSAYPRAIDFAAFSRIAKKSNAFLMADIAHIAGLVATGLHSSPVGYADIITSTTHKTLRGARGGIIMTDDAKIAKAVDRAIFPGIQGGPLMHVIAAKAVTFGEALQPEFKTYINNVINNAKVFAATFTELGVKVITNGTDNHLFTIDVRKSYGMSGKEAATLLSANKIITNKNMIPHDPLPPTETSGVRLGTPAMTTRGFGIGEFKKLALLMNKVLNKKADVKAEVSDLLSPFTK